MEIWLPIGLPASGKSRWANKLIEKNDFEGVRSMPRDRTPCRAIRISPDDIRFRTDCSIAVAWMTARSDMMDAVKDKYDVIILDATNLDQRSRREWHKLAGLTGYKTRAFLFDVEFDTVMERNAAREGPERVPDEVMERFRDSLSWPMADEGFESVEKVA